MICQNCNTELPVSAHFCLNCGQPVHGSTPFDQESYSRLTASAPSVLVEKVLAAARLTGERRMVTALYLDVVNSTGLNHRLGSETWGRLLNQAFDLYTSFIYRYEGTVAHIQYDEFLAFFGAPVVHEDDPIRAVRAALELLEAIRQFDREVQEKYQEHFLIRISLSTGPVTIGPVGSDLHYEYSALGGTLSKGVRLEATRVPMTVLVTEETHRFIIPFFNSTDLGIQEPSGISHPIHVFRVDGFKEVPGSGRGLAGLQSPLVGRRTELQTMLHLCEMVKAGLGRVVILSGEPGVGKSRLVGEWKAANQVALGQKSLNWIEGRSISYRQKIAYHLIRSFLRGLLEINETTEEPERRAALCNLIETLWEEPGVRAKAETVIDVYPFLAASLSIKLDSDTQAQIDLLEPQALQTQSISALRKLLVALAARQPMVIVLEDFHWADSSSIDVLIQLLPLASSEPILFCMVMRTERESPSWRLVSTARETLGDRLVEVSLNPLSNAESRQLVANLLQVEALPIKMRELILKKSEGNPFFMEEVIRMLIDRGGIFLENGVWHAAAKINNLVIPDNLQGLLLARIDRLPEEVKHTLRVASVIGKQFPLKILEQVTLKEEQRNILNHLVQLETAGLVSVSQVTPDLEYQFRHTLLHEAIYASLLDADRQYLNQQVGEALEVVYADRIDILAATLAEHFDEAKDTPHSLKYHQIAARRAAATFANQEAESHYRSAIELATEAGVRANLLAGLGETLYSQSRYADAELIWQDAIRLYRDLGNSDRAARLQARCARSAWFAGDTPRGLQLCLEGLEAFAGAPESEGMASLIHEAARASYFNGKKEEASRLCRQALDMAERLDSLEVQADALATLGILDDTPTEEALAALRKAVALSESAGLTHITIRALINLANTTQAKLNDKKAAREHYLHAAELVRKLGSLSEMVIPLVSAAAITLDMGELQQAEDYLADLQAIQPALPDPSTVQIGINALKAGIFGLQGRQIDILPLMRDNIDTARTRGDLQNMNISYEQLIQAWIEMDHLQGDVDLSEAEQATKNLLATPTIDSMQNARSYVLACIVKARQRQFPSARQFLDQVRQAVANEISPPNEVLIWRAELELAYAEGRYSDALNVLEQCTKYRDTMGRFQWARLSTFWAMALMERAEPGDLAHAQTLLLEAKTAYDAIGSQFYSSYVNRMLEDSRRRTEAQARVQKKVAQEMEQAGILQGSFLPQKTPSIPGWEVAAAIKPVRATTGDFYDFISLPGEKLGIVIADVADKGIGAALFMTSTRTLLRAYAEQYPEQPKLALEAVNRRITNDTQGGLFVTLFYGVLDPDSGKLSYCNAGHNPPFILQADGTRHELTGTGFPLGIFKDASWINESTHIDPGGLLVLYTDGLTEAQNPKEDFFGTERLFRAAAYGSSDGVHSASRAREAILGAIHEFSSGAPQSDDITLVVFSRRNKATDQDYNSAHG